MRLFILSITCGAIFLSGCASSQIPSTPVKGVSNEMFEGTWESSPDVKRLTAKIIFLPDQHCRIIFSEGKKIIFDNSSCSYKMSGASAIMTSIDHPKDSHLSYAISTTQLTPFNNGKSLDDRFLQTIQKDTKGKQTIIKGWPLYGTPINPNKQPKMGKYILHRVPSLKDIFSKH